MEVYPSRSRDIGMSGSETHGWRSTHHTSTPGFTIDLSLRSPALIATIPSRFMSSEITGDPHVGQKRRSTYTSSLFSPRSWYVRSSPLIVSWELCAMTLTENAPPLCRWQCSQWHTAVANGSPASSKVTDPHKQCPDVMSRL